MNSDYIRGPFQKSNDTIMTKADIVTQISNKTGIDRNDVMAIVEGFMVTVKGSLENGENVYLRGFGSFVVKKRAAKLGRNILANTTVNIPAHYIPAFRPSKEFTDDVKARMVAPNDWCEVEIITALRRRNNTDSSFFMVAQIA